MVELGYAGGYVEGGGYNRSAPDPGYECFSGAEYLNV